VRRVGARWLAELGVPATPDRVVVCAGAQHAILTALACVVGPGEVVLAETLTYLGLPGAARMLGLRVRGVALDPHGIVPESLEALCRIDRPRLLYTMCPASRTRPPSGSEPSDGNGSPRSRHATISRSCKTTCRTAWSRIPGAVARESRARARPDDRESVEELLARAPDRVPGGAALDTERAQADPRRDGHVTRAGSLHLWLPLPAVWSTPAFPSELARRDVKVSAAEAFLAQRTEAPCAVRLSISGPHTRARLADGLRVIRQRLDEGPLTPRPYFRRPIDV
jgi:hypothetical protein